MTISIRITGYNKHTAGPLRTYLFHMNGMACSTGREDQFAHCTEHARSIIQGLQALEPLSEFSIREINTDAHGAGTQVEGKDLFQIQMDMENEVKADAETRRLGVV